MMLDGKGCAIMLGFLALFGFIIGAIASIWFGPIAMLYGALGLPVFALVLVLLGLLYSLIFQR